MISVVAWYKGGRRWPANSGTHIRVDTVRQVLGAFTRAVVFVEGDGYTVISHDPSDDREFSDYDAAVAVAVAYAVLTS